MIIADENVNASIINALRENKIDVISIQEDFWGIKDEAIIQLSKDMNRIILTEDKDFGEWVFAHKVKEISVIFLRYSLDETDKIKIMLLNLINQKGDLLFNKFTTVTINKIRSREI
jgi:predicted nuclease of predicted toxin-antitoxin system